MAIVTDPIDVHVRSHPRPRASTPRRRAGRAAAGSVAGGQATLAAALYAAAASLVVAGFFIGAVGFSSTAVAEPQPGARSQVEASPPPLAREWVWRIAPKRFDSMWRVPR